MMANRHEYDPILRAWIYGGPGEEGFDHTVEGYNFWAGDMARGLVGTMLGDEPSGLHILILIGIIIGLLVAGTQVIKHREYATAEE